jgi:hypothetical protein
MLKYETLDAGKRRAYKSVAKNQTFFVNASVFV